MVELLANIKGKSIYKKYLPALQKEYNYWMEGAATLKKGAAYKRVVKLDDGTILNRYWDDLDIPRQEGYKEDVKTAEEAVNEKMMTMRFGNEAQMNNFIKTEKASIYKNLRAGAASGWDFSSRWFKDPNKISTIEVLDILPVDLNCLVYHLETTILKAKGITASKSSIARAEGIRKYFWNKSIGYFTDYNFKNKQSLELISAAGVIPFYFFHFGPDMQPEMGRKAAKVITENLLKDGGLQSTANNNGQQWDAPNGWAPQQWIAIMALEKCFQKDLAKTIATRWVNVNKKVYEATGKLMEKYNVVNMNAENGGGEYPSQDGFGWTNGVLLALIKKYQLQ
jgi:alpha,alpha-trehalase